MYITAFEGFVDGDTGTEYLSSHQTESHDQIKDVEFANLQKQLSQGESQGEYERHYPPYIRSTAEMFHPQYIPKAESPGRAAQRPASKIRMHHRSCLSTEKKAQYDPSEDGT